MTISIVGDLEKVTEHVVRIVLYHSIDRIRVVVNIQRRLVGASILVILA
jgi:hypothetical protein